MKKLITIIYLIIAIVANSQTPIKCIDHINYRDSSYYAGQRDSIFMAHTMVPVYANKKIPVDTFFKTCPVITTDSIMRITYITGFKSIAKDKAKCDQLIKDLLYYKFTYAILYSVGYSEAEAVLIARMKREAGCVVSRAFSAMSEVLDVIKYNNAHPDSMDFIGVTTEIEAYNQPDINTAFLKEIELLKDVDVKLQAARLFEFGNYLGWLKGNMTAAPFILYCDWTNLHVYQKVPTFSYMESRCDNFDLESGRAHKKFKIYVLFSDEPYFMQNWIKSGHTHDEAFGIIKKGFDAKHYKNIELAGYVVFTLDYAKQSRPTNLFAKMLRVVKSTKLDPDFKNITLPDHIKMAKMPIDSTLMKNTEPIK